MRLRPPMRLSLLGLFAALPIMSGCAPSVGHQQAASAGVLAPDYDASRPMDFATFRANMVQAAQAEQRAHPSSVASLLSGSGQAAATAQAEVAAPAAYNDYVQGWVATQAAQLALQQAIRTGDVSGLQIVPPAAASPGNAPAAAGGVPASYVPAARVVPVQPACPIGTHPWTDNWGNPICQSFATGAAVTTQANAITGCPNGAFPSMDTMGNKVCKEFGSGATYYDTSHGCPNGYHPWTDQWGNPTCQAY
jgi:hypothetical protein